MIPTTNTSRRTHPTTTIERALLLQVITNQMDLDEASDSLQELERLAGTAGIKIVGQLTQRRERPHGGTMIGKGKVEELKALVAASRADTVICDNPLNAFQAFNLGKALGTRLLDRTELILEIFARRARSAESQTQVELARLQFHLRRIPILEEQQRFTGRANVRGPGEAHLHRRNIPIRRRITELKKRLANIEKRQAQRDAQDSPWPIVSLVGYTNAGKSTLLNRLSGTDTYVDDKLFATLDTKTSKVWLAPAREVLMTDTVGFIRNLPHELVASFKSTLNIATRSDLLLIVVDAGYPLVDDHIAVCKATLNEIGAQHIPSLLLFNKCDRGTADHALLHLTERYPDAIPISAKTGYGLDTLKQLMVNKLKSTSARWALPASRA